MDIVDIREFEGKPVLTVATGMTARAFAQSKLPTSLSVRGLIARSDGTIDDWQPEGTICDETDGKSRMFIYGPNFAGKTLLSAISGNRDAAWKALHATVSVLNKAFFEKKIDEKMLTAIAAAGPGAILAGDDGSVLVLPPELYVRCIGGHGEQIEMTNRLIWIHPDHHTLNPLWAFSFMAGTLAYRIAAGVPPFGQVALAYQKIPRSEAIALDMRNGRFEPLETAVWAVRPAAAACINALVSAEVATSTDTLVSFGPSIDAIIDPAKEAIPESEEFAMARSAYEKKMRAAARRADFMRRYKGAFKIAAIVVVAGGILIGTFLNDSKSKPTTLGMTANEVVDGFYAGINALDQEIPQAYTAKKVKTGYDELLTNLYVTSKVRMTYEGGGSGVVSPAQLYALREPGNHMIYGMTDLSIAEIASSDSRADYAVSFYFWLPTSESSAATDGQPTEESESADPTKPEAQLSVYAYQDAVTVEYRKDRWLITNIAQEKRSLVEGDAKALLTRIASGDAGSLPYAPSPEAIAAITAPQSETN